MSDFGRVSIMSDFGREFLLISGASLAFVVTQLLIQVQRADITKKEALMDLGLFVLVGFVFTVAMSLLGFIPGKAQPKKSLSSN